MQRKLLQERELSNTLSKYHLTSGQRKALWRNLTRARKILKKNNWTLDKPIEIMVKEYYDHIYGGTDIG